MGQDQLPSGIHPMHQRSMEFAQTWFQDVSLQILVPTNFEVPVDQLCVCVAHRAPFLWTAPSLTIKPLAKRTLVCSPSKPMPPTLACQVLHIATLSPSATPARGRQPLKQEFQNAGHLGSKTSGPARRARTQSAARNLRILDTQPRYRDGTPAPPWQASMHMQLDLDDPDGPSEPSDEAEDLPLEEDPWTDHPALDVRPGHPKPWDAHALSQAFSSRLPPIGCDHPASRTGRLLWSASTVLSTRSHQTASRCIAGGRASARSPCLRSVRSRASVTREPHKSRTTLKTLRPCQHLARHRRLLHQVPHTPQPDS